MSRFRKFATVVAAALVIVGAAAVFYGCGHARTMEVDGATRKFVLFVPASLDASAAAPLVIAAHQFSDTASGMEHMTKLDLLAEQEGFIVAYPQGRWRIWNADRDGGAADAAFILQLIELVESEHKIDQERIYMTGASAGAMLAQYMATRTDRLAAIAPVMGPLDSGQAERWQPVAKVPVLLIHGKDDPVIPYDGGETNAGPGRTVSFLSAEANAAWWAEKNGCGGEPTVTEVANDVTKVEYSCPGGAEVVLYGVDGGGHTWPGGLNRYPEFIVGEVSNALDASQVIWEFFETHRRTAPSQ